MDDENEKLPTPSHERLGDLLHAYAPELEKLGLDFTPLLDRLEGDDNGEI